MMKHFTLLSTLLFVSTFLFAQVTHTLHNDSHFPNEQCLSDHKHQSLLQTDPEYAQKFADNQAIIRQITQSGQRSTGTLTIPVVVHVIHLGEPEGTGTNISDAQIQSAIDNMNDCYSGAAPYDVDIDVQFQLAVRDPFCAATDGILRVNGSGTSNYATHGITDANEFTIKALSKWGNGEYYNIWIVSEINNNNGGSGTQGYAYFPGASADRDGAVILYNSFGYDPTGSLGYNLKSYTNHNATANHEMGHAFNLYHTFQGDDGDLDGSPDQCPADSDCSTDGDEICDTDAHRRDDGDCLDASGTTCHGGNIFPVVENIMAYSSDECQTKFTAGQRDRMRAAICTSRASLLTSPALTAVSGSAPTANQNCQPQTTDLSNTFGMGVTNVKINTTEFGSSGAVGDNGYVEKWCNHTAGLSANTLYDVEVTVGSLNTEDVRVYIDYNNNGDFSDAGENIFSSNSAFTHSGTFTTPVSPTLDEPIWVRVISDWSGNNISGPCYTPQYGQVEDYSVTINSGATPPVAEFSGTPLTICAGQTVTFTDASTDATGWLWNFGAGASPATANTQGPHVVTYSSSGNKTVTLDVTGPGGSDQESKASYVTVNPLPNLSSTSSTDETCAGNDGTATVNPTGGSGNYTYLWDAAAANQTTQTANSLAAGTYGVTVTDAVTTCSAGTNVTVNDDCNPVPNTKIRAVDCGITVTDFHDYFYADAVSGATHYQFRFDDGQSVLTEIRTTRQMKFQWLVGVDYNTTYTVDVRAKVGGQWGTYGLTCNVSTPNLTPTTSLTPAFCGASVDHGTYVYANFIIGAEKYQFRLTEQGNPTNVLMEIENNNKFKPVWISGIANTTYDVDVRARIAGNWTSYGSICALTITGASSMVIYDGPPQSHKSLNIEESNEPTTVNIYPNPNDGQLVFLNVNNAGSEYDKMLVNVTDMYGKVVYSEQMMVTPSYTHQQLTFSNNLSKGMYFVNVIIGENKYSNKMIIK